MSANPHQLLDDEIVRAILLNAMPTCRATIVRRIERLQSFQGLVLVSRGSVGAAVARRLAALAEDGRVSHVQIGTQVYWRAAE